MHARAVSIEDSSNLDLETMLAVIVEEQGFSAALALIVAGARPDRVDIAPIGLGLRVNCRIPVHFAGRCLKNAASEAFRQTQHINSSVHRSLGRLHGIVLVMDR